MNGKKVIIYVVFFTILSIVFGMFIRYTFKGSYAAGTYTELSKPSDNGLYYNNLNFPSNYSQADPAIIKVDSTYYVYSTFETGIRITKSTNFKTWSLVTSSAISDTSGYINFWAPDIVAYNGKYYLFYTAVSDSGRDIWVAIADTPTGNSSGDNKGKFVKTRKINSKVNMPIDPNILIDDDGKIYLYTKSEVGSSGICCNGAGTSIYVEELNSDLLSVKSTSATKVLTLEENGWEKTLIEGNYTVKLKGKYYLMYSTGSFSDHTYTIGYAVSSSPTSGFTRRTKNTGSSLLYGSLPSNGTYDSSKYIYGTGHNSVYYISDDEMYIVYHSAVFNNNSFGGRVLNADYMGIDSSGNLFVNGPTTTNQPVPSGTGSAFHNKLSSSDYTVKIGGTNAGALKDNINYNVLNTSSSLKTSPLTPCSTKSTSSITITLNNAVSIEDIWLYGNRNGFGNATANVIINDKYIINDYSLGSGGTAKVQLPDVPDSTNTITINFSKTVTLSEVSLYGIRVVEELNDSHIATFKSGNTVVATETCTLDSSFHCRVTTPAAVSKSGYTFTGWGKTTACTTGIDANTNISLTTDETYYACFVSNTSGEYFTYDTGLKYDQSKKILGNIKAGTTAVNVTGKVQTDAQAAVLDTNDTVVGNSVIVRTGYKLQLTRTGKTETIVLAVKGDMDGDGAVNSADLLALRKHLIGTRTLTMAYFSAGDLDDTNTIDSADLLAMRRHLIGTVTF